MQTSSGYTGFGLQEPTWKPLGIQNAFSIEMMFLMGESVPRHFETHSEAVSAAHLLSRRGHGMGKRREGSRAREEKDRKETCQFSSLGTQHRLQLQLLSKWAGSSMCHPAPSSFFTLLGHSPSSYPLQSAFVCRAQSPSLLRPALSPAQTHVSRVPSIQGATWSCLYI